ncbi:MAG: hypothetical protein RLZZ324_1316 [Candidatus Parcubacteria bacterium]|jgi:drug/metabolite transporter (DMT)-like permease
MGYLFALIAFLIWGVNSSVVLRLLPMPAPVAVFLGVCVAAVISMATIGAKGRSAALGIMRDHPWRMLSQVGAFASTSLLYQMAIKETTVANAALTHALMPVFAVLVFEPLFYGNWPSKREAAAVALGMGGMAVLLLPQLSWHGSMLGIILGTLSAVTYAGSVMNQSRFPKDVPRDAELALILVLAAPCIFPVAFHAGFPAFNARVAGAVLIYGFMGFYAANRFYLASMERLNVAAISASSYLEPVVSIIVAVLFLSESVTWSAAVGGAMILGSNTLIVFGHKTPLPAEGP